MCAHFNDGNLAEFGRCVERKLWKYVGVFFSKPKEAQI